MEEEEEEKAKVEEEEEKEEEEQEFGSNLSNPPLPGSHPVQASGVPSPSSLCPTLCPTLKIRDSRWKPSGQKREITQDKCKHRWKRIFTESTFYDSAANME